MPLILGAQSAVAGGFAADNSCRFNSVDSAYMHKTLGTATSERIFTFSVWVKRGLLTGDQAIFNVGPDGADVWNTGIRFRAPTDDDVHCTFAETMGAGIDSQLITTPEYRDTSAWMHIVYAVDTPQAVEANRLKLFVNGVQMNDALTYVNTYPNQDTDCDAMDSGNTIAIGRNTDTTAQYFDGYIAEAVFIDGTAYAASDFGEYDEDSPTIWKPKDVSGLTFGNNGFYLDFEDSSNLGNDANGGTDLTAVNITAVDQCVDTPTNNFCTMNPLQNYYFQGTYSEGNCKVVTSEKAWNATTLGMTAGKWYWETNLVARTGGVDYNVGFSGNDPEATTDDGGSTNGAYTYYYRVSNGSIWNEGSSSLTVATADTGDIIGIALDLDNMAWYASKNGVWQNSGVPTSGASKTGACGTPMAVASTLNGVYLPLVTYLDAATTGTFSLNYGNPPYALTSAEADGNGYGQFEYAPPSGYLAICTKNLGSDGG